MPFDGSAHSPTLSKTQCALPFTKEDYFELVDVTGRILRADKRGRITESIPSIVTSLGINPDKWIEHIENFGRSYGCCIGSVTVMADYAEYFGRSWSKGVAKSAQRYA